MLAREGYTGPSTVLEGKYGLFETYTEEYDLKWLTEGLGEEYKIMGCKFKPYACCHELCPPIRLSLQAKKEYGFEYEDIEKISIGLNHITAENQLKIAETPLHAQNHPAVAVAIALVRGQVFLKEFFESYDDPRVIELGKKIEVYADPDIDEVFPSKIGTRVEITTKNEKITVFEEDKPPLPYSFVKEKFKVLASMRLPENNMENILDLVDALEDLENILDISALL
jgi:2-methylcitrate dehydratase PrpD